jgi:hypothetical protein
MCDRVRNGSGSASILFALCILGCISRWINHMLSTTYTLVIIYCVVSVHLILAGWQQFHCPVTPPTLRTGVFIVYTLTTCFSTYGILRWSTAMANCYRAPNHYALSTNETANSFENWKLNLLYTFYWTPFLCHFLWATFSGPSWKRCKTNTIPILMHQMCISTT